LEKELQDVKHFNNNRYVDIDQSRRYNNGDSTFYKKGAIHDCVLDTISFDTAAQTGHNISLQLDAIIDKFDLIGKIIAAVNDNA
jgi:hypothetical protein